MSHDGAVTSAASPGPGTPNAPQRGGGPRGSYAKSERTREAILEAALEVFGQSGYRSGSLRDVATRVGMTEAGLLHHFPNKATLLAAVLDLRDEHDASRVSFDSGDGEAMIRALVAHTRYSATVPGVIELFCVLSAEATSPDHPAHAYFVERYERGRRAFEAAFTQLQSVGKLVPGVHPAAAAKATIALMDGLQVQWLLDRSSLDMADELLEYFRGITTLEW